MTPHTRLYKLFKFNVEPTHIMDMADLTPNTSNTSTAAARQRKAVVPPKKVNKEMSVFDYLRQCQPPLDKKIIDIACSQCQVPMDMKNDAAQEISLMWSQMKPDTKKFKPGQIASYAHQMARHAALRLRREIGSSVRLPGSAFRKRKDGSSYVTPGVLAQALDWNELESWFQTDEGGGESGGMSMLSMDMEGVVQMLEEEGKVTAEEDADEATRVERVEILESHKEELSTRQFSIMRSLIEGANYEEVMAEHQIKKGVLMREVAVASSIIGPLDF